MSQHELDVITTGRPDLTAMAEEYGCLRGTRIDDESRYRQRDVQVDFLDLHWEDPDFQSLLEAAAWHDPKYIIAGDYDGSNYQQINDRARQLRNLAEHVIVVPHHPGEVAKIPEWAVVGYSTPTDYGGTEAWLWEYRDRPIHILGGTPHQQLEVLRYLADDAVSVDGNSYHKAATLGAKYWRDEPTHHWHRVDHGGPGAVVGAYERSLQNWIGALCERGFVAATDGGGGWDSDPGGDST